MIPLIRDERLLKPSTAAEQKIAEAFLPGCYDIRLKLRDPGVFTDTALRGAMRVERVDADTSSVTMKISVDLYKDVGGVSAGAVVPVFPRADYRGYLTLGKDAFRFVDGALRVRMSSATLAPGTTDWIGGPSLRLAFSLNPPTIPGNPRFGISVRDVSSEIGTGDAVFIGDRLRCATLHIASARDAVIPASNGGTVDWISMFGQADWKFTVDSSDSITHPDDHTVWNPRHLHEALNKITSGKPTIDEEWQVFLLCVEEIQVQGKVLRGVMFDFGEFDANQTPRQGCAIASCWPFPPGTGWYPANSHRVFGEYPPLYFRTAVHEVGHAFGLSHPAAASPKLMMSTTTDLVGASGFPDALPFEFSAGELEWLRHQPDPVVRPGGIPYPASVPSGDDGKIRKSRGLLGCRLEVNALSAEFPLGVPVRVQLSVRNTGTATIELPRRLGFSEGGLEVAVSGPDGRSRRARTNVLLCDEWEWESAKAGDAVWSAVTLLRCSHGAFFPVVGEYAVEISVPVRLGRRRSILRGSCSVRVMEPLSGRERRLARRVFASRELQEALVLGGHGSRRTGRLMTALLSEKCFRCHFAFIEAKRRASIWTGRGRLQELTSLLSDETAMTHKEVLRMCEIILGCFEKGSRATRSAVTLLKTLRKKTQSLVVPANARRDFESLQGRIMQFVRRLEKKN